MKIDELRSEVAACYKKMERNYPFSTNGWDDDRKELTIKVLKQLKTGHCYAPVWCAELLKLYEFDADKFGIVIKAKHEAFVEMPPKSVRGKVVRNAKKT